MPDTPIDRPLGADSVKAWIARHAFTERQAADAIGISPATLRRMKTQGASRLHGLAMAAIDAGLDVIEPPAAERVRAEKKGPARERRRAFPFR